MSLSFRHLENISDGQIKKNETSRARSVYMEKKNAYMVLVGKPKL